MRSWISSGRRAASGKLRSPAIWKKHSAKAHPAWADFIPGSMAGSDEDHILHARRERSGSGAFFVQHPCPKPLSSHAQRPATHDRGLGNIRFRASLLRALRPISRTVGRKESSVRDGLGPDEVIQRLSRETFSHSVHLRKGASLIYTYDFGDNWVHSVVLEDIVLIEPDTKYPRVLDGARACPPEDSGGPYAYADLLEILSKLETQAAPPDARVGRKEL